MMDVPSASVTRYARFRVDHFAVTLDSEYRRMPSTTRVPMTSAPTSTDQSGADRPPTRVISVSGA